MIATSSSAPIRPMTTDDEDDDSLTHPRNDDAVDDDATAMFAKATELVAAGRRADGAPAGIAADGISFRPDGFGSARLPSPTGFSGFTIWQPCRRAGAGELSLRQARARAGAPPSARPHPFPRLALRVAPQHPDHVRSRAADPGPVGRCGRADLGGSRAAFSSAR